MIQIALIEINASCVHGGDPVFAGKGRTFHWNRGSCEKATAPPLPALFGQQFARRAHRRRGSDVRVACACRSPPHRLHALANPERQFRRHVSRYGVRPPIDEQNDPIAVREGFDVLDLRNAKLTDINLAIHRGPSQGDRFGVLERHALDAFKLRSADLFRKHRRSPSISECPDDGHTVIRCTFSKRLAGALAVRLVHNGRGRI